MYDTAQLQFRMMSPTAQRAALLRLALIGSTPEDIARRTGLPVNEVKAAITALQPPTEGLSRTTRSAPPLFAQPRVQVQRAQAQG